MTQLNNYLDENFKLLQNYWYYFLNQLAATPLEASGGTLNVWFKKNNTLPIYSKFVVPSPKIVVNLPGAYEKLPC